MRIPVLGVSFDALTLDQAAESAAELLRAGNGGVIATVNPEILLRCRKDPRLAECVGHADLVLADGIGVVIASRILAAALPERVTGADLTLRLLDRLSENGGSVFLYGAKPGVAERAAAMLIRTYPGLRVTGVENGYDPDGQTVCRHIERSGADLVLVGLGAPRQERFMDEHRSRLRAVMIGVGGLLDVLSGDVPRAPERLQRAGLEWLYRLWRQPQRIGRVAKLPQVLVLAAAERWKNGTPKGPAG